MDYSFIEFPDKFIDKINIFGLLNAFLSQADHLQRVKVVGVVFFFEGLAQKIIDENLAQAQFEVILMENTYVGTGGHL